LYCTAQPDLQEKLEGEGKIKDSSSIPADRGTLCHEVAEEICFNSRKTAKTFIGKKKLGEVVYNAEMAAVTQDAVKVARKLKKDHPKYVWTLEEKEEELPQWTGLWGTCDIKGVYAEEGKVIVGDYKFGNGKVSAYRNAQLIVTGIIICQKNLIDPLADGAISGIIIQPEGENTLIHHLTEDVEYYMGLMDRYFKEGHREFDPSSSRCHFCACRPNCDAHAEANMKVSFTPVEEVIEAEVVESKEVQQMPALSLPAPAKVQPESVADIIRFKSAFDKWYKDFLSVWQPKADDGQEIPGTRLVSGRKGTRKWEVKDSELEFYLRNMMGLKEDEAIKRKVISPTDLEKSNPGVYRHMLEKGFIEQAEGKATLALEDDKRKDYDLSRLFTTV